MRLRAAATATARTCMVHSTRMSAIQRLGVLTGGGDAPGLNAVIRAVVKAGSNAGTVMSVTRNVPPDSAVGELRNAR